MRKRKRLRKLQ